MSDDTLGPNALRAKNRRSGRAVFAENGQTSWEWQTSTGVFESFISDAQLANLEASELTLLEAPTPDSGVDLSRRVTSRDLIVPNKRRGLLARIFQLRDAPLETKR